jgi:serine/threonine protein kinase
MAKCDQLPCAAKVLHPTILDPRDPGAGRIMERFQQECAFLESIRHPNIVQYLGMTVDPESKLPVLLMELLDESLSKLLERSKVPLPYYVQVDVCHDIALAVAYLHSNDIIHRDLSSNNVLIIAERRAKVTDFGMSKLAGTTSSMTPLTTCPGTQAYMPPEALRDPPTYTKKLDCFSEGVIMIQICSQLWPEPGPRTKLVPDTRSPTGSTEMPVLEQERRKKHIDLIDPTHGLLPIAIECLQYQEKKRPSSEELCQRLADLKEALEYRESRQRQQGEIQPKDDQIISSLTQQLRMKDHQIQQLKKQLKENEDASLQAQIEEKQLPQQPRQYNQRPSLPKELKLTLTRREEAKRKMKRGATVVKGDTAYFMLRDGTIRSYNSATSGWKDVLHYNYTGASLAIVNEELIAIGGCESSMFKKTYHNTLFIVVRTYWSDRRYPPMPTKRSDAVAVTSSAHLVVAGGMTGSALKDQTSAVEVMDSITLVWSVVASLPYPYRRASATACGDRVYILGGETANIKTKSVLTCSLSGLVQSSSLSSSVWDGIADAPVFRFTCAAVNEELLMFGGCDKHYKPTSAIRKYNRATNSWDLINSIPSPKYNCLVAVIPSEKKVMVVGGTSTTVEVEVEIDTFTFSLS